MTTPNPPRPPVVAIVMGSKSDYEIMKESAKILNLFEIPYEVRIISAHRTPDRAHSFAATRRRDGNPAYYCRRRQSRSSSRSARRTDNPAGSGGTDDHIGPRRARPPAVHGPDTIRHFRRNHRHRQGRCARSPPCWRWLYARSGQPSDTRGTRRRCTGSGCDWKSRPPTMKSARCRTPDILSAIDCSTKRIGADSLHSRAHGHNMLEETPHEKLSNQYTT